MQLFRVGRFSVGTIPGFLAGVFYDYNWWTLNIVIGCFVIEIPIKPFEKA